MAARRVRVRPRGALFVGRWVLARFGAPDARLAWGLLLGVLLVSVVRLVPVLGGLVAVAAMSFGLGAGCIQIWRRRGPDGAVSATSAAAPPSPPPLPTEVP